MFLEYWGLSKQPFINVPDPEFLFPSSGHEEAYLRLIYVIQGRRGAALLSGDIGCGKTLLSRALVKKLPPQRYDIALVTSPTLSSGEFLREIVYQFEGKDGNHTNQQKLDTLHAINHRMMTNYRNGKDSIVIVDEAHLIMEEREILEELRLLLNCQLDDRFLLTLILIGQPELEEKIKRVPALDQRIAIKCSLQPLTHQETSEYVSFRTKKAGANRQIFSEAAIERIYHVSQGIPRRINNICDVSLLLGYVRKATIIDEETVESAAASAF